MKHAARAIPVLAGILAAVLAGCAAPVPPPDDIQLTRRSATADDWSRHLPDLYRGLSACLAADPAQPAYALSVVPQNHGMVLVNEMGHDGNRKSCSLEVDPRNTVNGVRGQGWQCRVRHCGCRMHKK